MNEQYLIEEAKKGDQECFSKLAEIYFDRLYYYIYKYTLDENLSYDIIQDTFIKILKNINKYDPSKSTFSTYVFMNANSIIKNYYNSKLYRQRLREIEMESHHEPTNESDLLDKLVVKEKLEIVNTLLNDLKDDSVKVIDMKFYQEKTFKEISEELNYNIEKVKAIYYQTIKKLKQKVVENYE